MDGNNPFDFSVLLSHFVGERPEVKFQDHESLMRHLQEKGYFQDERAFNAMDLVSRVYFFPNEQKDMAFDDRPIRLFELNFSVSAPHMYARCLSNLDIEPGMKFLDIGCGCGHMTALGAYLVGPTGVSIGIDIEQNIIDFANENIRTYRSYQGDYTNISGSKFLLRNCFLNDPHDPLPLFDRIHCGAACPKERLSDLIDYLAPGGLLLVPIDDEMLKIRKCEDGELHQEVIAQVSYGDLVLPTEQEVKDFKIRTYKTSITPTFLCEQILNVENLPFNDSHNFDIEIESDGEIIYAHKSVLTNGSNYFRELLENQTREPSETGCERISVDMVKLPVLLLALGFMYNENIDINEGNLHQLLIASFFLKIEGLMLRIEQILSGKIDLESVCEIYSTSVQYNAKNLTLACEIFCLDNWEKISLSEAFLRLSPDCLRGLLTRFHTHICHLQSF